jgi:hypothetical protein
VGGAISARRGAESDVTSQGVLRVEVDHRRFRRNKRRVETWDNARVVWQRPDAGCACSDLSIPWRGPTDELRFFHDADRGLYQLRDARHREIAAFRLVEGRGHRVHWGRVASAGSQPMAILLLAAIALGLAFRRVRRAVPYATRIHRWKPARLVRRGFVEDETGSVIATRDRRHWLPSRQVLVSTDALEAREVYRDFPALRDSEIVEGDHAAWRRGTFRHLDDARTLAILAALTTFLALGVSLAAGG